MSAQVQAPQPPKVGAPEEKAPGTVAAGVTDGVNSAKPEALSESKKDESKIVPSVITQPGTVTTGTRQVGTFKVGDCEAPVFELPTGVTTGVTPTIQGVKLEATTPGVVRVPAPNPPKGVAQSANATGTVAPKGGATSAVAEGDGDLSASNYDELLGMIRKQMDGGRVLSAEELASIRRRKANAALVGGISDMARAMANMYYTSKGAPNAYNHATSMSEGARKHYDALKAERMAESDRLMSLALQAAKINDSDRAWRYQIYKDKIQMERQKAEDEYNAKLRDLQLARANNQLEGDKYTLAVQEAQAKYAEENARLQNEALQLNNKYAQTHNLPVGKTPPAKGGGGGRRGGGGRSSGGGNITLGSANIPRDLWDNDRFVDAVWNSLVNGRGGWKNQTGSSYLALTGQTGLKPDQKRQQIQAYLDNGGNGDNYRDYISQQITALAFENKNW